MSRPKRWLDLTPGLAVLACVALAVGAVLRFARIGGVRGPTTRVYAAIPTARGVIAGTEVWLAGHRIGTVRDVVFRPPSLDTTSRVLLVLEILERDRHAIRRDADVRIRPGGSVVGVPIVAIEVGSSGATPIAPNDTLRSRGPTYVERARADLAAAAAHVPAVLANLRLLSAQLQSARGTLGALGVTEATTAIAATARNGSGLADRTLRGSGTTGRVLRGGLATHAQTTMASVDSVRTLLLGSGRTSLGRFRRDSTILVSIAALQADLAALEARAASPDGAVGRVQSDRALRDELARTRNLLDALLADLKRNPFRYLAL
jgi:phospholipid/cholesterol/gamma-HCH transport system substrate-binding protein